MNYNDDRQRLPDSRMVRGGDTRELLSALVHLASELNSSLDLPELLEIVVRRACLMTKARAAVIRLVQPETQSLRLTAVWPTGPIGLATPAEAGICGNVLSTRQARCVNRTDQEADFDPATDALPGLPVPRLLCAPLTSQDRSLGVLEVLDRSVGGDFHPEDLDLFRAFADMAATALANALLHREALEKRRLEREMALAREIQHSFLPTDLPQTPGLHIDAWMEPARQVGGDFYDAFALPDGRVSVVVGDVSGKGASAALYVARLQSELRLATEYDREPAAVLERLNRLTTARSRRGAFVSLLWLLLDGPNRSATAYVAGFPPPLLLQAGSAAAVPLAAESGFPLGVTLGAVYPPTSFRLPTGSILLAYTDGAVEMQNAGGEEYGLERLAQSLAAAASDPDPLQALRQDIVQFSAGAEPYDDVTLLMAIALDS